MNTASPPTAASERPPHPAQHPGAPGAHSASPGWRHVGGRDDDHRPAGPLPQVSFVPQSALGVLGGVMMPLGLLLVAVGAYVALHASSDAGQRVAGVGCGLGGLAVSMVGGFLYIGTWFSHLVEQHRAADRRLAETLLLLADVAARVASSEVGVGGLHVTADGGATLHRRDCPLVAHRGDLSPADPDDPNLIGCRVCQP